MEENPVTAGEGSIVTQEADLASGSPKVDVPADEVKLTAEEQQDLAEAVEAERIAAEAPKKFDAVISKVEELHGLMVDFCGRSPQGPLAYCRSLAQTKLEEFVHRMGDARAIYKMKEQVELQAFRKAQANGNLRIVPGGK